MENMLPQENLVLEQRVFMKGFQRFEIHQDDRMEITVKPVGLHRQFKLPIWQIDPNPERILHSQTGNLIGFIFFGMLALLLVIPLFVSNDPKLGGTLVFPAILIGILSTVCLRRWRSKSVDVLAFHTRPGGQLHIWFEKPDAKSFRSFCETLIKKAEQAWRNRPLDPSHQSLAGEIAALKKLKDSGVLNDAEFERAKSKILEQAEQRKIGFI